jgi:ornithine cyclodeaminase/alanine dehydrogenase-like protein (mu-crystallin family)
VVCAVGAVTPDRRELDDEAMRGAVVVESREAGMREPGDILLAKAEVSAEIGELLNGGGLDRWCSSRSGLRSRISQRQSWCMSLWRVVGGKI